ncbi:hypothetical protein Pelo_12121 [Pelomyxa schiedti]|nr:hypothetical protein Pelo_12121 [Pelomyxa schiedti]
MSLLPPPSNTNRPRSRSSSSSFFSRFTSSSDRDSPRANITVETSRSSASSCSSTPSSPTVSRTQQAPSPTQAIPIPPNGGGHTFLIPTAPTSPHSTSPHNSPRSVPERQGGLWLPFDTVVQQHMGGNAATTGGGTPSSPSGSGCASPSSSSSSSSSAASAATASPTSSPRLHSKPAITKEHGSSEEKYRLLADDDADADDDAWNEGGTSSALGKIELSIVEPDVVDSTGGGPLKIADIECCYAGPYGPAAETPITAYYPHSQIVYRFSICGLKVDSRNKTRVTSTIRITDSVTHKVLDQNAYPSTPTLFLGGDELSGFFNLSLAKKKLAFGMYAVEYSVMDHRTGQTASFSRNFKYERPTQIVIAKLSFYSDSACTSSVSLSGWKGESRYMKIVCEGLTPSGRRVVAKLDYNIRDVETNQLALRTPNTAKIDAKIETPTASPALEFTCPLKLTKAGKFVMCLSVVDITTNINQSLDIPFTVIKP